MQVKTYRGANSEEVIRQIKAELGPEAVILDTKTHRNNGSSCCEMTAALEESVPGNNGTAASSPFGDAAANSMPGWGQWHQEWNAIKEHLGALLRPQMDLSRLVPRQRLALEYLEREGVSLEVVLEIFRSLSEDPDSSVLAPLERMLGVKPLNSKKWPGKMHGVVGPHGVGKTSVLLRMAMRLRKEQPGLSICLVNADSRRSQGKLVLKHYADLSDITYRETSDPEDMARLLAETDKYDAILFDLPGLGRDMPLERFLSTSGLDQAKGLHLHLALSPQYSQEQLRAFLRQYRSPLVCSLIWTKLDEAFNYGGMVNAAQATGLPTSALSCGPGLTATLVPAKHSLVWRLLFKHQLPDGELS
ncbi:MAG: flagellar biosynthesis protein FlhF [Desulfovibrio sp.]|nr:MAG: flagellar biosynthesis protein FlhF [Desulfovibrio sp.]